MSRVQKNLNFIYPIVSFKTTINYLIYSKKLSNICEIKISTKSRKILVIDKYIYIFRKKKSIFEYLRNICFLNNFIQKLYTSHMIIIIIKKKSVFLYVKRYITNL